MRRRRSPRQRGADEAALQFARKARLKTRPGGRSAGAGMPSATGVKTASPAAYAHASLAIANLRGVFILILVSFHASLAYLGSTAGPAASFTQPPFQWLAFPIVDSHRFYGFDLYCAWEDVHVMALMFFLSGVFVPGSLRRKGAARFLADRVLRLALPFLFSVAGGGAHRPLSGVPRVKPGGRASPTISPPTAACRSCPTGRRGSCGCCSPSRSAPARFTPPRPPRSMRWAGSRRARGCVRGAIC